MQQHYKPELDQVLGVLARAVEQVADAPTPLIPEAAERLRQQVGHSRFDIHPLPSVFPRLNVEVPKST
jgi:hypothetical protein